MIDDPWLLARTLGGVAALAAVATATLWAFRVPHRFAPIGAIARGALQLALISFVLSGVISNGWWVALVLVVMFTVAWWTAARRGQRSRDAALAVGVAMGVGVSVALTVVFATGSVEFTPRYALALGGIVIGGAMTVAGLTGRRFTEIVDDRWNEVEGWLALGAPMRHATLAHARAAVHSALMPATDQTKTTGLVTLPGAFVGAIFGGLSPLEAGRFQVVVLAAIMAAGALTAVILAIGLGGRLAHRPVTPA